MVFEILGHLPYILILISNTNDDLRLVYNMMVNGYI